MKKDPWKIILIISIVIFSAGCRKEHNTSAKQLILFQYDYSYAEDGSRNGFLIENKGNVMIYNNPKKWNSEDELTDGQVIENIQNCVRTKIQIPEEELHKFRNYITNIASSKITAKRTDTHDKGTARFICFQYSESTGKYKAHLIKMEGDSTCENLNFYSKKVTFWMRNIGKEIDSEPTK